MRASPELVQRVLEDRPFKLTEEEVNYRGAEYDVAEQCETCVHFFERVVDGFKTCELMRPDDGASVKADYVCDFWESGAELEPEA